MNGGTEIRKKIYSAVKTALSHYVSEVGVVVTDSFVKDAQGHLTEALCSQPRPRGPATYSSHICLFPLCKLIKKKFVEKESTVLD